MIVELKKWPTQGKKWIGPPVTAVCFIVQTLNLITPLRRLQNVEIKMAPIWEPPYCRCLFFLELIIVVRNPA